MTSISRASSSITRPVKSSSASIEAGRLAPARVSQRTSARRAAEFELCSRVGGYSVRNPHRVTAS
jgi:hypothetical protein